MNMMEMSGVTSLGADANQMNAVSGASGYVPPAAVSTDPALDQMRSDIKQNSQDFHALKRALQSNNLNAATQAFTSLQSDIQNASQAAGGKSPFDPNSPIGKDFQAVGAALNSGNLSAAKQAFAAFRLDIKSAGRAARAKNLPAANDGDADDGGSVSITSSPALPQFQTQTVGGTLNTTA